MFYGPLNHSGMRYLLATILLFAATLLVAQRVGLSLRSGITAVQLHDPQLSPRLLSGSSMLTGLAFAKISEERWQQLQLSYASAWLHSPVSHTFAAGSNTNRFHLGQFTQRELWAVHRRETLALYGGFLGHATIAYRRHHYLAGISEDQFEGAIGFGPAAGGLWHWRPGLQLQAHLGWALFNYVASKDYSPRYFQREMLSRWSNFRGPGQYTLLQLGGGAEQRLSSRLSLALHYQLQYYEYLHVQQLQHSVLLGGVLKLGKHE